MKNNSWSIIFAFLLGAILFGAFGKDWLNLESVLVFLAGLIGVALPVLLFGTWTAHRNGNREN